MNAVVPFPSKARPRLVKDEGQPVPVGEALVNALRDLPEPAKTILAPVADEVEGGR